MICALLCQAEISSADVIVDVQDATIAAGQLGFVDVWITSTAAPGTPDNVDFASYNFGISAVGATGSAIDFTLPPDFTESTTDASYLFAGDTAGMDYDDINSTASSFIGFDATDSFAGINLDNSTTRLLVRLDLQHVLGPGQTPALANGERFRITLLNSVDTFFDDLNGDPVGVDGSSFAPLGVGGGLITVTTAPAAVPEPGSFAILVLVSLFACVGYRRRSAAG